MPRRRTPGTEPTRGLPKSEGQLSTSPQRKLPEELWRAWLEHVGKPGSDMEAAYERTSLVDIATDD
jgi:hypothetical protein